MYYEACKAAADFDPARGNTFATVAHAYLKKWLGTLARHYIKSGWKWHEWTDLSDTEAFEPPARHHRPVPLAVWCDDEARFLRRRVQWRGRIILYLRTVECLTLDDVSHVFGISKARVRQIQDRAIDKIAAANNRRAVTHHRSRP